LLRMLPEGSLMEEQDFDLLPRNRRIVCQNTLFADKKLESNRRPNSFHDFSLDFFTAKAAAIRSSEYWDCKSDDELFCNKALNASFFAQIAFLTSWFHQGVLFSLSPATLSRFCSQHSTAEAMIADLNNAHSISMSSDSSRSCLNFAVILDSNCFLTSLSFNASYFIL